MKTTPGFLRVLRVMGIALAATLSAATMSGCDNNTTETVLSGDNCAEACQRYATCYDASFNTTECTNRCVAAIADSSVTVAVTEACLDCIGDSSCGTPTYTCAAFCAAVIAL